MGSRSLCARGAGILEGGREAVKVEITKILLAMTSLARHVPSERIEGGQQGRAGPGRALRAGRHFLAFPESQRQKMLRPTRRRMSTTRKEGEKKIEWRNESARTKTRRGERGGPFSPLSHLRDSSIYLLHSVRRHAHDLATGWVLEHENRQGDRCIGGRMVILSTEKDIVIFSLRHDTLCKQTLM